MPGVSLKVVMEEADAELMERIFSHSPHKVKLIIDAAFFLHMDDLLRRLTAGIMAGLDKDETKHLVSQSKKSKKLNEL